MGFNSIFKILTIIWFISLFLSGCSEVGSTGSKEVEKKSFSIDEHFEAKRTWNSAKNPIERYELSKTSSSMFGFFKVTVHVEGDVAVSCKSTSRFWNEEVSVENNCSDYESSTTVETLFDRIEEAFLNEVHYLHVTYNPKYGYPTSIFIDGSSDIADDEGATDIRLTFE